LFKSKWIVFFRSQTREIQFSWISSCVTGQSIPHHFEPVPSLKYSAQRPVLCSLTFFTLLLRHVSFLWTFSSILICQRSPVLIQHSSCEFLFRTVLFILHSLNYPLPYSSYGPGLKAVTCCSYTNQTYFITLFKRSFSVLL
jgi:hypothetical protein